MMEQQVQMTTKDRDIMIGQVVATAMGLQDVKRSLQNLPLQPKNDRFRTAMYQAGRAWEEVNKLLRSLGYLLEEPDNEVGLEENETGQEDNEVGLEETFIVEHVLKHQ